MLPPLLSGGYPRNRTNNFEKDWNSTYCTIREVQTTIRRIRIARVKGLAIKP
jgi:hypothetical protein